MTLVELGRGEFLLNFACDGILPDTGAGDMRNIRSARHDQQHTAARRQESVGPSPGFCTRVIFDLSSWCPPEIL